jgi:hypothetical protein
MSDSNSPRAPSTTLAYAASLCCLLGSIALILLRNKTRAAAASFTVAPLNPKTLHSSVHPIAVIIPALNEAAVLPATVSKLFSGAILNDSLGCPEPTVLVVDAGNDDAQARLAPLIRSHPTLHFVPYPSSPSRGAQQNFGAQHSAATVSPVLLFLHADTLLPPGWDAARLYKCRSSSPLSCTHFVLFFPHQPSSLPSSS